MTVSDYIFDFLQKKGTDTVFMVSGSSAMWLTDALKRNEKLTKICNHHEQAAVMSADIYSKVTNKVGAALVTVGPGATNAITGVAEAYVDSSALFVISGQINSKLLAYQDKTGIRQNGCQSISLGTVVSSITKYFAVIDSPEKTRKVMEEAYAAATTGRLGPVWIDVPVNIQNNQVPDNMEAGKISNTGSEEISGEIIEDVSNLFIKSKRPLIYAGQGVKSSGAKGLIKQLCEDKHIPIVTSRMGIDVIESESLYFVGRPGGYGNRAAHFALQNADLILVLGCRMSVSSIGYYPDRLGEHAVKIQVDIDPLELAKDDVPKDIRIQSDIFSFLSVLNKNMTPLNCSEWVQLCQNWRKRYPAVNQEQREAEPINTYYFTEKLSDYVKENATIVVDTGTVCNVVSQTWNLKKKQNYLISGGLSCMGYWAGAIGACYGGNDSQVIAITGDGSLQMNIQEFATMKYNNLPLKLFVYNNSGYLLIRHNQHNYMNDRFLGVGPDSGVYVPDVCAIANAYGLKSIKISQLEEIDEKIEYVMQYNGPIVCEVICDSFQMMEPRLSSKVMPDGSLKASEFDDLFPFLSEEEMRQNRLR